MSGFQVGDVVVCVDARPCACCNTPLPLKQGKSFRVSAVYSDGINALLGPIGAVLALAGVDPRNVRHTNARGFAARRFRKIRPASDEFISALRACKPERIGEPSNV